MMSKKFYVWVVALTSAYTESLIGKFVKRGYVVRPLDRSGSVTIEGSHSATIALEIETPDTDKMKKKAEGLDAEKFIDEVKTILGESKAMFHTIIVHEVTGPTWCWSGSNLPKPEKKEPTRFDKVGSDKEAAE